MRKRILWISLLITVAGLILYSLCSAETYYSTQIESSKQHLQVYMNAFTEEVPFDKTGAVQLSEQLNEARVTFMTLDGTVVADSESEEISENHSNREEVLLAIQNGDGFDIRNSKSIGIRYIYYCKRFEDKLVRIAIPTASEWNVFVKAIPNLIYFLLVDIVICFLFTYLMTGYMLKPVAKLSRQAASRRKCFTKYQELQPIADIMNRMNEDIQQNLEQIRKEQEIATQAQQSKNEFISNVTHEMNTPLTSIRGYAEWLNSGSLNEEQTKKAIATIVDQSNRLSGLISCIINYNQIDHENLPSYAVDLSKTVTDVLEVLEPAIQENHLTLQRDIAPEVQISSRHELVTELVGNLVRNAIKYNRENGSIFVSLTKGEHPVLVVRDTGIGIAPENQEKVFDRFFTVDKSHGGKHGGFGLGLAVVKKICQKSGWSLTLESELNVGTVFTVRF